MTGVQTCALPIFNAMYGPCNYKAVNWETRQGDGYTTEEYEAFSAAFNAATKA